MKGFVCIAQGCYVNKDLIDKEKTQYDSARDKAVVIVKSPLNMVL